MRGCLVLLSMVVLVACGRAEDTTAVSDGASDTPSSPVIYTVNYPLAWAATQLAGGWTEVRFPMQGEGDPAFWQPNPAQLAAYQRADLILLSGAGYARWLSRASLPENRMVDTAREFTEAFIAVDSGPVHSHGPGGDHSHGELAFTLWLDLGLYAQQAQEIGAALQRTYPGHAADIAAAGEVLLEKLLAMDDALQALGRDFGERPVLYSHPVYQYFERAYGFNGRAVHWEPDRVPAEGEWSELAALLLQHPARIMLWEDEPLPETRDRLRQLGVEVVVFAPMGNRPRQGDFLSGMLENIERLRLAAENHVD